MTRKGTRSLIEREPSVTGLNQAYIEKHVGKKMSSVNYTIVDFDNDLDEFLVVYTHDEEHRILVSLLFRRWCDQRAVDKKAIATY